MTVKTKWQPVNGIWPPAILRALAKTAGGIPPRSAGRAIMHGTQHAYNKHKCRCTACQTWRREKEREDMAKRKAAKQDAA